MNESMRLLTALLICLVFSGGSKAEDGDVVNSEKDSTVTMALTKLDVGDENLQLSWRIRNNTDHDVWLCDSITPVEGQVYEHFLDTDEKTLVIRRRFDVPMQESRRMSFPPLTGRYVRLGSGQDKTESLSLAIPIMSDRISEGECGNAGVAGALVVEIGFYDEDLPGLILQIVQLAERLGCDLEVGAGTLIGIVDRFFGGWAVAQSFKHIIGFSESVLSGTDEVTIPYMGEVLDGEKGLRIEVDGVSVPLEED